jgi:hypothetical protein
MCNAGGKSPCVILYPDKAEKYGGELYETTTKDLCLLLNFCGDDINVFFLKLF